MQDITMRRIQARLDRARREHPEFTPRPAFSATGILRDLGVTETGRYKVSGDGGKLGIVLVDFKERAA